VTDFIFTHVTVFCHFSCSVATVIVMGARKGGGANRVVASPLENEINILQAGTSIFVDSHVIVKNFENKSVACKC
jgi:hypothetical protein